ncbi:MAG TPA: hypothetical protein VHE30_01645 [Polyangiaceae bacterium]|nr:hypothetical protein [Polyangiaceae bacterium]
MFRTRVSLRTPVVTVALGVAVCAAGCEGQPSALNGPGAGGAPADLATEVALALSVPPGQIVDHVDYTVFGNGELLGGLVDTSDPNAAPSVEFGLPEGTGYTVSLSAVSRAGVHCSGSKTFDVTAGITNALDVDVLCDPTNNGGTVGGTIIGGNFIPGNAAACPDVSFYTVAPLSVTSAGGRVFLMGSGTPGTVSASWSVSSGPGVLDDPTAASTLMTCVGEGTVSVVFTVTDGLSCTDTKTASVTCLPVQECGNGILEPGEGCEPPNTATCDSGCRLR